MMDPVQEDIERHKLVATTLIADSLKTIAETIKKIVVLLEGEAKSKGDKEIKATGRRLKK